MDLSTVDQPSADDSRDTEWAQRRLCSDESCIGTIGPDGRCRECGLPVGMEAASDTAYERAAENADDDTPEHMRAEPLEAATGDDDTEWAARRLCSDESCIGTIGPDGRCRECGRPIDG